MANEEEMESFGVSERDYYDALRPGERRYKKMTKNQQIYGVFDDSDGEDERPSSSKDRFPQKKQRGNDPTTPLQFVKGGIQQQSKQEVKEIKTKLVDFSESDEEDRGNLSSGDEEILSSLGNKSKGSSKQDNYKKASTLHASGSKTKFNRMEQSQKNDLGNWEKHTKGIGAKLLLKMGYQPGKGLGKTLQGRSVPVEAQLRKGRGAVGLYGSEHKNKTEGMLIDSEEEEEKEFLNQKAQWMKGSTNQMEASTSHGKSKTRYVYKTIEQVIEEEATQGGVHKMAREYSEISKTKVIDMTGPEKRVLSGYSALSVKRTLEPNDSDIVSGLNQDKLQLANLAANLDIMVNLCENKIRENDRELSRNQDQVVAMDAQVNNLKSVITKEKKEMKMLKSVLEVLDQLEQSRTSNTLDLNGLFEQFGKLEKEHPEEYNSLDLANVALTYLIPLVKTYLLQFWRPFEDKSSDVNCRQLLSQWRPILENRARTSANSIDRFGRRSKARDFNDMDPYHGLVWHGWTPSFAALTGQWNCKKQADFMVDLLDCWESLLPDWVIENILDLFILPKIQKEVDGWNPLTDLIPIHSWIHPWLPRLNSKLETVYPTIRQKMAHALKAWTPSDQSARSVLLPWVPVFSKGSMDAFLVKNILPKLQDAILNWNINPSQQKLDEWHWVMNWKDLMPLSSMVTMLEKCFFPKWLQVLHTWINHAPNYQEIVVWFTGWKSLFPPEIAQHPAIKDQLTRALDLMTRSMAAGGQVDMVPAPPVIHNGLPPPPPPVAVMEQAIPHGIREFVEFRCAQKGILFVPMVNRWQANRPVFRIGNLLCYFDRQVAFVMLNGVWVSVPTQQLLDMAVG